MSTQQRKKNITFLLSYSSIFCLGAWRNSIELWVKRGYAVNLIQFKDENFNSVKSQLEENYNLIQIHYPFLVKSILYLMKYLFRSLKKIGLHKISTIGDGIDYLFKSLYFVFFALVKLRKVESEIFIGGDPPSLFAAFLIAKRKKKKLIFWELELLIEKELPNFGERLFKRIEKKCCRDIICAIEFGEKRSELLRQENNISSQTPIFSIPNSRLGTPKLERNYYFNEKFNIPKVKKIVLFAGGIITDMKEIGPLWESFQTWTDEFVLVFHSRIKNNFIHKINIPEEILKSERFFFHDEPMSFDAINQIYASCDVGLILSRINGKLNSNLYYSEWSLGKLFHYFFVGVPVISRKLFGYDDLIEKNGVGHCFRTAKDIKYLLLKINENESFYKNNCMAISNGYAFEKYHSNIIDFIKSNKLPENLK